MTEMKYFKPKSLTWWASLVPLVLGGTVATEPMHDWAEVVESINNATGNTSPYLLINAGLLGIGIRGAKG